MRICFEEWAKTRRVLKEPFPVGLRDGLKSTLNVPEGALAFRFVLETDRPPLQDLMLPHFFCSTVHDPESKESC